MAKRVAGTCYVKLDGEQLELSGEMECPAADVKREAVMSKTGLVGYAESAIKQYVKGTFIFTPGFPLDTLKNNTELTITAELANGRIYTLSGAFLENEAPVKSDSGTIELEFAGRKGIWQ